jgi:hypothetical protein
MKLFLQQVRQAALDIRNRSRVAAFANTLAAGGPPIFVLVSPADLHFAPLAVILRSPLHRQVFVCNGLSASDLEWLSKTCPDVPMLKLDASLSGNAASYLAHGKVIELLASSFSDPFFIQDADCFVLNDRVFSQLTIPASGDYASGPYWKECPDWDHILPDTYLVGIQPASLARVRQRYGVGSAIYGAPPQRALTRLRERGLESDWRPEAGHGKHYFDTMQLSWVLATLNGETFRASPVPQEFLHHVGGTSYLAARPGQDLSHWDWWPLNTCYTTLCILERNAWIPLRRRFDHLFQRFGSAEMILKDFPEFSLSKRYEETVRMFAGFPKPS